jgi:hypothetical protein
LEELVFKELEVIPEQELQGRGVGFGGGHLGVYIVYILYSICKTTLMGYLIKIQKVDRPTNRSYYLNLPVVLAETMELNKGEEWEWFIEDKNTLVLVRKNKKSFRKLRKV